MRITVARLLLYYPDVRRDMEACLSECNMRKDMGATTSFDHFFGDYGKRVVRPNARSVLLSHYKPMVIPTMVQVLCYKLTSRIDQ